MISAYYYFNTCCSDDYAEIDGLGFAMRYEYVYILSYSYNNM